MKKLLTTKYAQRTYYMMEPVDFEVGVNYAAVLMAIAGADGELADRELQWYLDEVEMNLVDAAEYIEAVRAIDWKSADLDGLLSRISYDFPLNFRHTLLYQAIKMCAADSHYHEKERAAIARAAEQLGVERGVLAQIEALVELDAGCERLRKALFTM